LTTPKGGALRECLYRRLRRHWQFVNEILIFADVDNHTEFGLHVYGPDGEPQFLQAVNLLHPSTLDASLVHDGEGEPPAMKHADGDWDLRPHRERIVKVDEPVLREWVGLFDPPGTAWQQARLFRPQTAADQAVLTVFANQPHRLRDHEYLWVRVLTRRGRRMTAPSDLRWPSAELQATL
jgi:hypothetical protein